MRQGSTADRIVGFLLDNFGIGYTNSEIADALNLPAPSIRRTVNELRATNQVIRDIYASGRTPRWMAA